MSNAPPDHLSEKVRQFLEDAGLFYEGDGLPPMAGRLIGWLLLCDPPHQTAAQLAETLGASAGSISAMTRMLGHFGLVERIAIPGQRSAAYRLCDCLGPEHLRRMLGRTGKKRALLERARELAESEPASESVGTADRLAAHLEFLQFIERQLPELIERWEREKDA